MPGLLGAAALVCGSYFLSRHSPLTAGLLFITLATALLIVEAVYRTYCLAGAVGTAFLAVGACKLFDPAPGITAGVAIPVSIVVGGVTMFLGSAAKRAKRNKRSDL